MSLTEHKFIIDRIQQEINVPSHQITKSLELLLGGASIPFIARYRKEVTGSLDELVLAQIRDAFSRYLDLEKRREAIIESVKEQGKLTGELEKKFRQAGTMTELEDLYLPYRPKRKTRATIAMARGLEPLAKVIFNQTGIDPQREAEKYIKPDNEVNTTQDAIAGAKDIIAEWVNEDADSRAALRRIFEREARISSRVIRGKKEAGKKYESWFEWDEKASSAPSHRLLAMFRGENEGFLKLTLAPDEENALLELDKRFVRGRNECARLVGEAVEDAYKRLLQPSLENEYRNMLKEVADKEAIRVFAGNLRQLLLSPPLGQKRILAIDPGFRTGCKLVCLDREGRLLHNETIYPHPPHNQVKQSTSKILSLVSAYDIEAIAIGNGTAGRETEILIKGIRFNKDILAIMVSESGASVYSASNVAREEFPDYDVTVRGAVSIGRRLADPLAELVKIDPKSIGVGQYQHDVDQKLLKASLDEVVMHCVNAVGVEVNTASKELLTYVSGIGPALASSIVAFRDENGPFDSRQSLKKVPRLGEKAFEQAAGFLRVRESDHPLDKSAVHPESYAVVERMAKDLGVTIEELIMDEQTRASIDPKKYITEETGLPTLMDIMQELARPGRDPRKKFDMVEFDQNIRDISDLREGMALPGVVTNITAFGIFVDIGVHQDGLVHISQMSDSFVRDPSDVVSLHQKIRVKVLQADPERKRISLSMKDL